MAARRRRKHKEQLTANVNVRKERQYLVVKENGVRSQGRVAQIGFRAFRCSGVSVKRRIPSGNERPALRRSAATTGKVILATAAQEAVEKTPSDTTEPWSPSAPPEAGKRVPPLRNTPPFGRLGGSRSVAIVFLSAVLFWAQGSFAYTGLPIERAQRDFQARYHYLTGGYVGWPNCRCGNGKAPHFPPDGFYGDALDDPEFAASLVQDLADKFFRMASIYNQFVAGSIDGLVTVPYYTAHDMPSLNSVTTTNYPADLVKLQNHIARLTTLKANASQTALEQRVAFCEAPDFSASCDEVKEWASTIVPSDLANAGQGWDETTWVRAGPRFGPIQVRELTGTDVREGGSETNYLAQMTVRRGMIYCDLTQRPGPGRALCYLRCVPQADGVSNGPPISPDGTFHAFASAPLGSEWSSTVVADFEPSFSTSCPPVPHQTRGWMIIDQVVIVTPSFDASPDAMVMCDSCRAGGSGGRAHLRHAAHPSRVKRLLK